MQHTIERHPTATVIVPTGELDVSRALEMRSVLVDELATHPSIIVDLSDVAFIDSSGIGMLVAAHRTAKDHGGWFAICGAQAPVQKVLELTRTDRLLNSYPDASVALEHVPEGAGR